MTQLITYRASDRGSRDLGPGATTALTPYLHTAVGKLPTLNCPGGNWPTSIFSQSLLSSNCGTSVVSYKRVLFLLNTDSQSNSSTAE
jgi:hypothetical protein